MNVTTNKLDLNYVSINVGFLTPKKKWIWAVFCSVYNYKEKF